MKIIRVILALVIFLIPLAARTLWFYSGVYQRTFPVETPDFASLKAPEPPLTVISPVSSDNNDVAVAESSSVVLVDLLHGNLFNPSEVDPLYQAILSLGAQVEIYDGTLFLDDQLKHCQAFVTLAPTMLFSQYETHSLVDFVENGGHLLVVTDPTRNYGSDYYASTLISSVNAANQLLAPFKISFGDDYVYNLKENEGNFRNLVLRDLPQSPLTEGVNELVLYSAHSLTADQPLLSGDANTFSSLTDQGIHLPLAALSTDDRVLAIGDLTFMTVPYDQVANNRQFTRNIALFLAGGQNPPRLDNFPVLFSRPVALFVDAEKAVTKETLELISGLQSALQASFDLSIRLATEPVEGHDLILPGKFDDLADLDAYLKPYDLEFVQDELQEDADLSELGLLYEEPASDLAGDEDSLPPFGELYDNWFSEEEEDVEVTGELLIPGVGTFKTQGVGVVIYLPGTERNVLILLAGSEANLNVLAGRLSGGSLAGCLVSDEFAVCSLGEIYP